MALNLNKGGHLGKYFYIENNVEYGPVEINELLKYINRDTLIYFKGIKWTKASEIPELKKFFSIEEKVVEKIKFIEKKSKEEPLAPKKNIFIIILLIFILIGGISFYYDYHVRLNNEKYEKEQELIIQRKKNEEDSIAISNARLLIEAKQDSINIEMNSKLDSMKFIEKKVFFLQNQPNLIGKIKNYYYDITNNQLDAFNYFSDTVLQFITLYNLTPDIINSLFTNKKDFINEIFLFNEASFIFNRYYENVFYFDYKIDYECYRPKKNKKQSCNLDIEIGFDEELKIKSYKEIEVKNLIIQ
jgi:hypothetical protein